MSEEEFYIKDLQPIREFCLNSDKEDVYKYIYSLQQENEQLQNNWGELKKWLESKNNITLQQHKTIEPVIKVQDVIDKIKEVM